MFSPGLKQGLLAFTAVQAVFAAPTASTDKCQQLQISIPDVKVNILEFVPNGTNLTFPYNDPTCARPSQLVYGGDLCRVAMYVATSNASGITLEAWLPTDWNGRFLSTGNGGISGCIQYEDIAYAASFGFASVGANNGHNGTSGKAWLNAPGVIEDYVWRSMHTGVVVGKQITEQYYGSPGNKSYYLGCSTGGRQGMKSAQSFPEDFDGIVAGAPAFDFNHLTDWSGWLGSLAGYDNTSSSFVTLAQWQEVNALVLSQCDSLDGAKDNIIEDPDLCTPHFETLLCASNATNTSTCLNPAQFGRVLSTFQPLYGLNGTLLFPRLQPGAHAQTAVFLFNGQPFAYTTDWFRYAILNDPSWDPRTLDRQDMAYADSLDLFGVSTWSADLHAFANRGAKLITYHGMQDPIITSDNSKRYYAHLAEGMGMPPNQLDEFYRYFRISGMGHCTGGPGAWDIGQKYAGRSKEQSTPENNVLMAIVDWVENGNAPEKVTGFKWVDDVPAEGEEFTRNHCRYPLRNAYTGSGNGTDVNGWSCVE